MKIALIYSQRKSSWKSCQAITENLIAAYSLLYSPEQTLLLNYHSKISDFELWQGVKKIVQEQPDKIIITDHTPHPYSFFLELEKLKLNKNTEIIIHVFGDFTLYVKEWIKSERILKGFQVKFICASTRQKNLIESFISNNTGNVFSSPFPVNTQKFYYSPELRSQIRKKNFIEDHTTLFVYTGRISKQKNVIELIQIFSRFIELQNPDAKLILAGQFDNIGIPFIGYKTKESYENACLDLIHSMNSSKNTQDKIIYSGNLDEVKLCELYNASDVYISLSVHNDEDFGMAPAEALCCGLPSILTNWAGYASFKNEDEENYCHLIPTKINDHSIDFSQSTLLMSLIQMNDNINLLRSQRKSLEKINQNSLSINTVSTSLEKIMKSKVETFNGFSELFYKMEIAFQSTLAPFGNITYNFSFTDLYKNIYEKYVQ
jgi:glycosyltransferase involved in cell wall biosynthesis